MSKKTVVIGASENNARYSNMAVRKLQAHQHPVIAIGRRQGNINGTEILVGMPEPGAVDTVTLYLNPENQKPYYDYILSLKPQRIIFNPGAENDELETLAEKRGIKILEACTLVLLSTGQY